MEKTNLVLLHGALGSRQQFGILQDKLSPWFRTSVFDFPGHGGLPLPHEFSIPLFVENTMDFIRREGLEKPYLFGYSMGGYVALQAARDHPGEILKVMTLGTKFQWNPESAAKEVRMMDPDIIEQKIPAFAAALRTRHAPQDWKQIMRLTGEMMTGLGDGMAMKEIDFLQIQLPVLVSIGASDHMVTLAESETVAKLLPGGRLRVIDGFKHPLESIDADVLADISRNFFLG